MTEFFNTGLSQQAFLKQYWQKQPLLIRQAFPAFQSPISPDELAGLACEDEVESRLVEEHSKDGPWRLRYGPFDDEVFAALPDSNWTLLVQDVDKHLPELSGLLKPFAFIPDWRRDDLMISFAPVGGSVGPHTDGYDVFLLQAMGSRRWQISDAPVLEAELIDGVDLRILSEFTAEQSWELEPGDMLYLPPHFAHHGVALNDCMTFSVGFRAPKQKELLDSFIHTLMEQDGGQQHYADPDLQLNSNVTEIDALAKQRFKKLLVELIESNEDVLSEAIGRLVTETKPSLELFAQDEVSDSDESIAELFKQGHEMARNRYLRFAWTETAEVLQLFVAGEMFCLAKQHQYWVNQLTVADSINDEDWRGLSQSDELAQLMEQLVELGAWYWR